MSARPLIARLLLPVACCTLASLGRAQLSLHTTRELFPVGTPLVVTHAMVNPSFAVLPWNTQGQRASLTYSLKRVDIDDPVTTVPFDARINGGAILSVRRIDFRQENPGAQGGTIGPLKSAPLGTTLGYSMPVDLLRGYMGTYGATPTLTTSSGQSIPLAAGERLEILTAGHYDLQMSIYQITIAGTAYGPGVGYLTDAKLVEIVP